MFRCQWFKIGARNSDKYDLFKRKSDSQTKRLSIIYLQTKIWQNTADSFFKTTLSLLFYVLNLFTSRISFIFSNWKFSLIIDFLFLATRGLCHYTRTFPSCGEWGRLSSCGEWACHCSGFSCGGTWALGCTGFSGCGTWAQLPRGMWKLPDQGVNQCPLQWQVDSLPLDHQGSPTADSWTTLVQAV